MGYRLIRIAVIVLALLALSGAAVPAAAQEPEKTVLVISSYHQGDPWTDQITEGIRSALEGQNVKIYFEEIDSSRTGEIDYDQKLYTYYLWKYEHTRFDAIICSDDTAFKFLLKHRVLSENKPVIFCGLNYLDDTVLANSTQNRTEYTGVVEDLDIRETLDVALSLHPSTREVVVVNDRTDTGLANQKTLEDVVPEYTERVSFAYLDNLTAQELERELQQLPADRIVLFLSFNRDRTGRMLDNDESLDLISRSSAPVYSLWNVYLGHGIVGGRLIDGTEQGRRAGEMALFVLQGGNVTDLPIERESDNHYMFDYRVMRTFGIDRSDLPSDSTVINLPDPFYAIPKYVVWGTIAGTLALMSIILILLVNITHRRRMEEALRESEEKFRGIAQRSFEMIYLTDKDGRITYASPAVERITGFAANEVVGRYLHDLAVNPTRIHRARRRLLDGERQDEFETALRRKDGAAAIVEVSTSPVVVDGRVVSIQGAARDITERVQMEALKRRAFEQIEQNIEQFAILGDHIRNPLAVIIGLADMEDGDHSKKILEQAWEIDRIIDQLDKGWIESEKVREFLHRQYGQEE